MKFKLWRKKSKMTLQEVADELGISYQAVQKIEAQGLQGARRISQIEKISGGQVRLGDWL